MQDNPRPVEYVALGALLIATVAFSLIRIDMTDTPWHLATARLAFDTGNWPVQNTFSYTYPEYPLYQQYPVYQSLLYLVYSNLLGVGKAWVAKGIVPFWIGTSWVHVLGVITLYVLLRYSGLIMKRNRFSGNNRETGA